MRETGFRRASVGSHINSAAIGKSLRADRSVLKAYFGNGNIAIPTLFVIDRKGIIRDKIVGFNKGALNKSLAAVME